MNASGVRPRVKTEKRGNIVSIRCFVGAAPRGRPYLSRAGDPAGRLGEGYGSLQIKGQATATVAKSGPGLGGGVAAPTENHFIIRDSEFDNQPLFLLTKVEFFANK